MTLGLALAVRTSLALAGPLPPPTPIRKPVPAGMTAEVIKRYVGAIVKDKAGDLAAAARLYQDVIREGDVAGAHYNLADVYRRMEKYDAAIRDYKKYVELAPDAPDRATVEKLIAQLENADFTVVLDGAEPGAVILLDGKLLGPSPQVVHLPPGGRHAVDRISPTGHRHGSFEARAGRHEHEVLDDWSPHAHKDGDVPGNVVISTSGDFTTSGSWRDKQTEQLFEMPARQTLAPGHYESFPWNDGRTCAPLVFDVPRRAPTSTDVTFVYLDAKPRGQHGECQQVATRVTTVRIAP